jgi:hypothetical protein
MRKYNLFSGFSTMEKLESRLSLSSFSFSPVAAAVSSFNHQGPRHRVVADSEPPPAPDPGDNPPVVYPILPPGGASGPGS